MRWSHGLSPFVVAAGLITAVAGDHALASNYAVPLVDIVARVNPDGSVWITEHRTYEFSGPLSEATYTLERRGWIDVTNVTIADEQRRYRRADSGEPGTFRVTLTPKELGLKWHFRGESNRKTFTIRYRLVGAVTRYRDTAELYWRFVRSDRQVRTARVEIRARIPRATQDVLRAWAHGPPNTLLTLHEGEVRLSIDDLPAGEFVEGRIVFPGHLVPGARLAETDALPRILAEEARWQSRTNLERLTPWFNLAMFPVAIISALAVWLILYMRAGTDPRVVLDASYVREPPAAYPPAILGALLRGGRPAAIDFAATILDLARHGHLTIAQETNGPPVYRFIRVVTPITGLAGSEQQALELLFRWASGYQGITDAEFRSAMERQNTAGGLFREWQQAVEAEARAFGFFDEQSRRLQDRLARAPLFAIAGGIVLTAIAMIGWRISLFTGLVALPLGGLIVSRLRGRIARRTVEGATHLAQWRAFRRYLSQFSTLKGSVSPPPLDAWEAYLPYAVSLGVADRVIEQLRAAYPDVAPSYAPSVSRLLSRAIVGIRS